MVERERGRDEDDRREGIMGTGGEERRIKKGGSSAEKTSRLRRNPNAELLFLTSP